MTSGNEETVPISGEELLRVLEKTLEIENELLRTYVIASEGIQGNEDLRVRLQNFAEGNAKRTRQLIDEIKRLRDEA